MENQFTFSINAFLVFIRALINFYISKNKKAPEGIASPGLKSIIVNSSGLFN
jgi:hypothetical protein